MDKIYQIKITLIGSKPPIWRRLLVPGDITIATFHEVLQAAMGWWDCHLHEFQIGEKTYGIPDPDDRYLRIHRVNEKKARLGDALGKGKVKVRYTYDFGDNWEHNIEVEKVLAPEPDHVYPVCIKGMRSCPPEDCGGICGYYKMLEALQDPTNDQHHELLHWLGGRFDPRSFSVDRVNKQLADLKTA